MTYTVQVTTADGATALDPLVVEADSEAEAKEAYIDAHETTEGALVKAGMTTWTVLPGALLDPVEESEDDGTDRAEGLNAPDGLGVAK